jgi:hypothetical protein
MLKSSASRLAEAYEQEIRLYVKTVKLVYDCRYRNVWCHILVYKIAKSICEMHQSVISVVVTLE